MNGVITVNSDTLNTLKKYQYNNSYENNIKFTSIVILTYNQLNYTKLCIESIRKFTQKGSYEIIVVDNGSTDSTVEWLKTQADLNVIYNSSNNGFPAGCNQGVEISKGESILFLNNDTIVTPNWLDNLDKALYSSPDIGVVGAISNSCSNMQQITVEYKSLNKMISFAKDVNVSNKDAWDRKVKLIGFCYLIKKSLLDVIGNFDERFSPGNYEDDDLSFRVLQEGYKLLLCKDAFIHHFGSVSFNKNPQFVEVFYTNQAKIREKWGFDISHISNIRVDLISLMESKPYDNINVLEIGAGMGATLLQIKNQFRNANIYGIETNDKLVKLSNNSFSNKLVSSLDNMEIPYEESFFDYVILSDNLGHVVDTSSFIKNVKKHLKPNGCILCSVPNFMNISVIKSLILGRLKYENHGIIHKDSLRFFTLAEIEELFKENNFGFDIITATAIPLSPEDESLINTLSSMSNPNIRQQYQAYQYILRVTNREGISNINKDHFKNLKFKLLRIDNDIDIEKSLEYIKNIYLEYKDSFILIFKQLLIENVINKEKVLNTVKEYMKEQNLLELYNQLEEI